MLKNNKDSAIDLNLGTKFNFLIGRSYCNINLNRYSLSLKSYHYYFDKLVKLNHIYKYSFSTSKYDKHYFISLDGNVLISIEIEDDKVDSLSNLFYMVSKKVASEHFPLLTMSKTDKIIRNKKINSIVQSLKQNHNDRN